MLTRIENKIIEVRKSELSKSIKVINLPNTPSHREKHTQSALSTASRFDGIG